MNFPVKKLGFGLMRLPQKDGVIDIEQTKAMVDKFQMSLKKRRSCWRNFIAVSLFRRYARDACSVFCIA